MKRALLAFLVLGTTVVAPCAVRAKILDSPEVHQVRASAELQSKKFYWDEATHRLVVALTYATPGNPDQTVPFHFTHIRYDMDEKRFVLDLGNGKTVVVAHKFFLEGVILERDDHLLVRNRHGVVRIALDIAE